MLNLQSIEFGNVMDIAHVLHSRITGRDAQDLVVSSCFIGHAKHPDGSTANQNAGEGWFLHENEGIEWISIKAERVVDVAVVVGVPSGREQHPIQPNPASLVIHLVLVPTACGDFDRHIEVKGFHCHPFRGRRCRSGVDDLCVG